MCANIIEAVDLSRFYGKVVGLNQVNTTIQSGITGLLGPNGAGKTTFQKLMIGQIKPSKGQISTLGQNPWKNLLLYKRIGYCPEYDAFYYGQTGRHFVTSLVRLYGFSSSESVKLANEAIKIVEMEGAADRAIGGYSKGMKQRMKFAQAIAHDPELLIMDEPLAGADPVTRIKLMFLIKDMSKAGKSVIVSSHVLHEIEKISPKILLVYQGKVLASGKIHEIRELIYQYPHEVKIKGVKVRKLAEHMLSLSHIQNISFIKDENGEEVLYVKTSNPSKFYGQLPKIIESNKLNVFHISSTDDNLDSVFRYLIR